MLIHTADIINEPRYKKTKQNKKKLFLPYANNKGADQTANNKGADQTAQSDQRLCYSLPRWYNNYSCYRQDSS